MPAQKEKVKKKQPRTDKRKNIGKVAEVLAKNPQATVREIAQETDMSIGAVHNSKVEVEQSWLLKKLQEELEKKSLTYYNNAANKYGVDEVKTIKTLMTPEEARNDAATKTADALNKKGVAPEYVLKYSYEAGEEAKKLQASLISNAVKEGKESAKIENENRKETTKTINDEIKTLEEYKLKIGESNEKEIWYDSKLLKISEAQELIDEKISKLKSQRDNLK